MTPRRFGIRVSKALSTIVDGCPLCFVVISPTSTSMDGITIHADSASVNLNFWVTPDEANLDPTSGGLVVYPKMPPEQVSSPEEATLGAGVSENRASTIVGKAFLRRY